MEPAAAGPIMEAPGSNTEAQEEKNTAQGPPTLTRNRSFKSKQLVRSQAIRESQSPPRLPSPLPPPTHQSETNPAAPSNQSNPVANLNTGEGAAEIKTVLGATPLRGSDNSFNLSNNASSKNSLSSLNENNSDRNASQCRAEVDAREWGGGRNKQRVRKGDRAGEGRQRREGKECQQVEIQITSGGWDNSSPVRNRSPKNKDRDNQDRHSRTQVQKRWLSTKQSSQDYSGGWRSLEEGGCDGESWRGGAGVGCVCGSCVPDKECLWSKWRICPDCRGRKNQPRCPSKQDSGVVCSDDCSECSELTSPEIVLSSANSDPMLATDRRRGKDTEKYSVDSFYTLCRCHERNEKLSNNNNNNNNNSINTNKNTAALLKHLVYDDMDNKNNELSGPPLVQFIRDTLNKSIKDRISLLRIEKELISLVNDTSRTQQKFPSMTSYGRMLVHRCARLFSLQHKVEPTAKEAVIVTKIGTFGGRVPCTPFRQWCSVQFPDTPGKLHQDITQAKSILKRSAHSLDETVAARGSASARSKSFEQREEEYERVRKRIFSGDEARRSAEDDFNWQHSEENITIAGNNHMYGKLLTPDTGGGRQNKLVKVHSLETRTGDVSASSGISKVAVSKSHSFGGYGYSQPPQTTRILSRQGDLASSSWRLSPSSSGYKTLSLRSTDSVTPSPTGDVTPEPDTCVSPAVPLLWAVTDMSAVPVGSIIIHPKSGMPITNPDGSTYHYDPVRPPRLAADTQTTDAQIKHNYNEKKSEYLVEKRRGRLEKQHSISAPDSQECIPDTVPEYITAQKCCLQCCQLSNEIKTSGATQSGQCNTLATPITHEPHKTIDKATSPKIYYQNTYEPNYAVPNKKTTKDINYVKPHTNYIPQHGGNYPKNVLYEGQIPETISQKMCSENPAYYQLGFSDVSGSGGAEYGLYHGQNSEEGTHLVQHNQEPTVLCGEGDTQKLEPQQGHYLQDGAACQPLALQLAAPGSYTAQVAEHCRMEQNVVQAYALTHQQLVPVQQPTIIHYAQPTAPPHDKPMDGMSAQPGAGVVYGAYGTCTAHNCGMMDPGGGLIDPGVGLMDPHPPLPPQHHTFPMYHDPAIMAQRYAAGLQVHAQTQAHRQPTQPLIHHTYQYPTTWTTQWPLLTANPNLVNQNCPTPITKPPTPPTVFVPQPDLTLAYQPSNPALIQYPGLIQYPPVNYTSLLQPHLIHTQPYICPSIYPQQFIDARSQIPTPSYADAQIYQANRSNNSGIRSYESFQSANSRNYRDRTNVRSPKCHSRTGSVSGSSRTTPLGGQFTPPSNLGENLQQDDRYVTYPMYRGHVNTSAYCCNPNDPISNQVQNQSEKTQRNNDSNTYQGIIERQNTKGDQRNTNDSNTPDKSNNDNQSNNTDVYTKRRAFRTNASRSHNSLSRQDSFDQSNANIEKDRLVYIQEKITQIDIAKDETNSKDANKLNVNESKPFVSNLSPNSQNFIPKNCVKTTKIELNSSNTQNIEASNQTIYTKNRVYGMPLPTNFNYMEREMPTLRAVENNMRSSQQNQELSRSYVAPQNAGKTYNSNESVENSSGGQSQPPRKDHCNIDSCQLKCESKNLPKTNSVETNTNVSSNSPPNQLNSNVNYQKYGVPRNFDTNYSDAVKKCYDETAKSNVTRENLKSEINVDCSENSNEYETSNEQESIEYENRANETQPNTQLLKAISNINSGNKDTTQNTNEIVKVTENNTMQKELERGVSSQNAIYARPLDTSTVQGVSNAQNYQTERTHSFENRNNLIYDRNITSNERSVATSISGTNYPFNHTERGFQPRNSGSHSFVRRDGGFRFRFNSRGAGFRAPPPGAVQQLQQQMQLQYGRPFMFARQMYTGGWSRRSPSPLPSNFPTPHQNTPRYPGPRPVRPTHYQERYNPRR